MTEADLDASLDRIRYLQNQVAHLPLRRHSSP